MATMPPASASLGVGRYITLVTEFNATSTRNTFGTKQGTKTTANQSYVSWIVAKFRHSLCKKTNKAKAKQDKTKLTSSQQTGRKRTNTKHLS